MAASDATPTAEPTPGIDHRHIFAASAFGLASEELDDRMVRALAAAEEEDRRRGFIRVDTNSDQLADALGVAFYEGYHGKPLGDKEWAGATALHYRYAGAGIKAVALLREMTAGAELEAVGAAAQLDYTAPDDGEEPLETITQENLADVLDRLASAARSTEEEPFPDERRAEMAEWGVFDPERPLEGTVTVQDEATARRMAEAAGTTPCRRLNVYHGCIVTYGEWQAL